MSKNFQKFYEKVFESEKLKNEIEKAKEHFEIKPFVKEYWSIKTFTLILSPVLSLFSILTAFGFLFYQFATNLHFIVAGAFACILLVFLEVLKLQFSAITFKKIFLGAYGAIAYSFLFFTFLLYAGSVFTSVQGAKEIYKQIDKSEVNFSALYEVQKDSIDKVFAQRIASEKQALNEFKSSVSWQGKINVNDKTVANTINSYTSKIDSLEADKRKALSVMHQAKTSGLSELQQSNGFNIWFWLTISAIVEVLILLCSFFKVWYWYGVNKENELFGTHSAGANGMNYQDLQTLGHLVSLHAPQYLPMMPQNLGINSGLENQVLNNASNLGINPSPKKQGNTEGNQENSIQDLGTNLGSNSIIAKRPTKEPAKEKDIAGLIQVLESGYNDGRVLMETYRVNVDQLNELREKHSPNYKPKSKRKKK